ncbi:MAG: hypothetical protein RIS70_4100, partial [Planctomycetota bacterium]
MIVAGLEASCRLRSNLPVVKELVVMDLVVTYCGSASDA